jgi:hypothetical protein
MFQFQSFHIYGIIGSIVVIGILGNLFIKKLRMKDCGVNPIVFHDNDKSVIRYLLGVKLFGLGLALAGSFAGPMFVLMRNGYFSIFIVFAGAFAGTMLYGVLRSKLPHSNERVKSSVNLNTSRFYSA